MSQTTETLATVPEQKGPGAPQNLPTDLPATPGRAITAAAPQQADSSAVPDSMPAADSQQADSSPVPDARSAVDSQQPDPAAAPEPEAAAMPAAAPDQEPATISAATPSEAAAANLTISAEARWPESAQDQTPPSLPGFIVSTFSPIAAETASRCLSRRPATEAVTAVLITTARGDRESAAHVAHTVAEAGLLGPLLFFQSVPNAVAGHIAARWHLTGPVVCLADPASALETAALLIEDGDADEVLLVRVEQGDSERDDGGHDRHHDQAHAVLLRAAPGVRP